MIPNQMEIFIQEYQKKEVIFFFNDINLNSNSEEIIYNIIAKEGLPFIYIYKFDKYTLCEFDENYDDNFIINDINLIVNF